MNTRIVFTWLLRVVAALIMLQTLYFKFTAQEESVSLFTALGMEPWGRIGTGVVELIASILLLIPASTVFGAILGIGLMSGALFFHFTKLGINFGGDSLLFSYALIVWICCFLLLLLHKQKIISLLKRNAHV
jgi:uncharacterized membrane protein YphA (DoxX/SURF4 family)